MSRVEIIGFAGLRDLRLDLDLDLPQTAAAVKGAIASRLDPASPQVVLLARAALGTDTAIYRDHDPIPAGTAQLALLPPVSGG